MFGGRWRLVPRVFGALLLVLMMVGCSDPGIDQGAARPTKTLPHPAVPATSLVAQPNGASVSIYSSPSAVSPSQVLPNPWLLNGVSNQAIPQDFLVVQTQPNGWVQVLLPERPNGSTGWLAPRSARLLVDQYRVEVSLHRHRISVLRLGRTIYSGPVATGAQSTPTPTGVFYLRVLLHTTDPSSPYGPYAYGLSAHSEALTTFDGGDAEIGIHGNNDPALLGGSVTHGCVRMDNAEISLLATRLPLGTPVTVSA